MDGYSIIILISFIQYLKLMHFVIPFWFFSAPEHTIECRQVDGIESFLEVVAASTCKYCARCFTQSSAVKLTIIYRVFYSSLNVLSCIASLRRSEASAGTVCLL